MLVALPLLVLAGGAVLAMGWRASTQAIHPRAPAAGGGLTDFPSLSPEPVAIESSTGVALRGRLFRGRSHATIVLSHGYGGTQDEVLPVAAALHERGFTVFTYDSRGCGTSGGTVTFGALEAADLRSVVDALAARPDVDGTRIGAYGFSMGGAVTLLAAAADARIGAVAADSAWAHVGHWLRPSLRRFARHPADRFSPLALKLAELRTGIDLDGLRPAAVVGRIAPRPLLLLHGGRDSVVPVGDARENAAAAGPNAELVIVPGVEHGDTLGGGSPERVAEFFGRTLRLAEAA